MSAKNTYKLTYFDVKALGEPIRWIFHYKGIPFEDDRIVFDLPKWFGELKKGYKSSVGQIPTLLVNGKQQLCQSTAISRYLADEFGLLGETSWDRARGDEVICLIFDLFDAWRKNVFNPDLVKKAATQPDIDQKFHLYYSKFNDLCAERTEGNFLCGKKVTHADFWLASYVDTWQTARDVPAINLATEYPALNKHRESVLAIPQIKKWIAERPNTF